METYRKIENDRQPGAKPQPAPEPQISPEMAQIPMAKLKEMEAKLERFERFRDRVQHYLDDVEAKKKKWG